MAKLNFEPVVNKIGGDSYLITPKNAKTDIRCVIRCNEIAADIICALYPEDADRAVVAEMIAGKYGVTAEEALEEVNGVIGALASTNTQTADAGGEEV